MFDLGVLLSFMLVAAIGIFVVLPLVFGIDIPGGATPWKAMESMNSGGCLDGTIQDSGSLFCNMDEVETSPCGRAYILTGAVDGIMVPDSVEWSACDCEDAAKLAKETNPSIGGWSIIPTYGCQFLIKNPDPNKPLKWATIPHCSPGMFDGAV